MQMARQSIGRQNRSEDGLLFSLDNAETGVSLGWRRRLWKRNRHERPAKAGKEVLRVAAGSPQRRFLDD